MKATIFEDVYYSECETCSSPLDWTWEDEPLCFLAECCDRHYKLKPSTATMDVEEGRYHDEEDDDDDSIDEE